MIVGEGQYRYDVDPRWEQLPAGWSHGDVAGVATDSDDRVYVFNRSEHPLIIYDRDGKFLGSWGEGTFTRPHGITITADNLVYLADDTEHTVRKFTLDGKLLQTLGTKGQPSDTGYTGGNLTSIKRGAGPFNRPTRLAVAPNGDLYVSDGYGNASIHRFTSDGQYLKSWGAPGTGPGEFNLPHSVWVHTDSTVWVCDRENDRIQIFSPDGEFLRFWGDVTRPGDLYIDKDNRVYVGEMSWVQGKPNLAGRIWSESRAAKLSVRDIEGNLLSSWGGSDPCADDGISSPHGLWVGQHGDVYIAEVTQTALGREGLLHPGCHSLLRAAKA
jgi:DNA-binding beta-propeller fold protein YncE